jgi:hypothetical protein
MKTYCQDFAHDVLRFAANVFAELVEGLEVGLVQRVPDDLDVHLVQVLLVDATLEEWSWKIKNELCHSKMLLDF